MAAHEDDEQTAADFNPPSASFFARALDRQAVADKFISDGQPWMAEMYVLLADMLRKTGASVAAQEG